MLLKSYYFVQICDIFTSVLFQHMIIVHGALLPSISSCPTTFLHILFFLLSAAKTRDSLFFVSWRINFWLELFSSKLKFFLLACNFLDTTVERILAMYQCICGQKGYVEVQVKSWYFLSFCFLRQKLNTVNVKQMAMLSHNKYLKKIQLCLFTDDSSGPHSNSTNNNRRIYSVFIF